MNEYIKKSDLMDKVVTETLSDYTEDDVIYVDVINQLPTYSFPDREKGEWINPEPYFNGHGIMKTCNKCGFILATHKVDKWIEDNFCPKCGADMRGKADETN